MVHKINIAIDGFSACGKSTLAQALARKLGYHYIDSGAMYRAVTLYALRQGLGPEALNLLKSMLNQINITCQWTSHGNITLLNGEDVSEKIRSIQVQNLVSPVSTIPEVRRFLVAQQKIMAQEGGIVMDGRDIGTKVMPEAELKIFMQADLSVRIDRRYNELIAKGMMSTRSEIASNLSERDHIDSTRADSPLTKADDAIVLDNSNLKPDEQLKVVLKWVQDELNQPH